MKPRTTENMVSSLLRNELQRLGVGVELFPRITTPTARARWLIDRIVENVNG
ncbi:MAG: hypothetical protein FGF53_01075 [Candidatus Brockarchaeota archaeon]|nr:hypothetical protein [Candidatus Brockarchaeota archaeon]MBO3808118.1 hypothetical protein [Candidatus Brockarchaeota archaeon]MBO3842800.1 hypothetical protein [Candidatus Brockarchaeota archaeon]